MDDQPIATDQSQITAQVFKQWTIKIAELGKAGILAGLAAGLLLLYKTLSDGKLPTVPELVQAGTVALTTALAVIIRDFTKSTRTVIKGQAQPFVEIRNNTVVSKEVKPQV